MTGATPHIGPSLDICLRLTSIATLEREILAQTMSRLVVKMIGQSPLPRVDRLLLPGRVLSPQCKILGIITKEITRLVMIRSSNNKMTGGLDTRVVKEKDLREAGPTREIGRLRLTLIIA